MSLQLTSLRLIGLNSFSAALRNKVMYLVLFLALLVFLPMVASIGFMRMAAEAGETAIVQNWQFQQVQGIFNLWSFAALILGISLGAGAISSEIRSRTIVIVLSKPVERWVFLAGRWFGGALVLLMFLAFGFLLALIVMIWFGLETNTGFWLGLAQMVSHTLLYCAIALLLGTLLPPLIAGGGAFVLMMLSGIAQELLDSSSAILRGPALAVYYLLPSSSPGDLLGDSLRSTVLDPDYWPHVTVLLENMGYTVAVLLIGCSIFAAREVRVR